MSASTTTVTRSVPSITRRKARLLGAAGATAAALAVWAAAELLGMNVLAPGFQGQPTQDIGAGNVVFSAGAASLAGWGLLALLERLTSHAPRIWTSVAALVFLLSLGGPMSGAALTGANRVVLLLMHVAVAAVLITVMPRTTDRGEPAR